MATWQEMSADSLRAARQLAGEDHLRSSISRSYYAAYCAVTGLLVERRVTFARGWKNPGHEQMLALIQSSVGLSVESRRRLRKLMRLLRKSREDADYKPDVHIDRALALNCIRYATPILTDCGV